MEIKIGSKTHPRRPIYVQTTKIRKSLESKPRISPIIQTDDVIDWASPGKPFARVEKKQSRPLLQLCISIAGALLIGTVMGFAVLALFFSDQNATNHSIAAHVSEQQKKPAAISQQLLTLPKLQVFFLQAGNYQSKASATKMVETYRTKGFAAVMSAQAPYRIYLGVAADKTMAQQMADKYKQQGISVYIKQQTLQGQGKKLAGLLDTLQIGNQLFNDLQTISTAKLAADKTTPLPTDLSQRQQAFMKANQLSNGYPTEVQTAMVKLARGLDQAIQGAEELQKHQNDTLAWFIQEGLIRYATGYEYLLAALIENK
jgi:stage II sporulation protein B